MTPKICLLLHMRKFFSISIKGPDKLESCKKQGWIIFWHYPFNSANFYKLLVFLLAAFASAVSYVNFVVTKPNFVALRMVGLTLYLVCPIYRMLLSLFIKKTNFASKTPCVNIFLCVVREECAGGGFWPRKQISPRATHADSVVAGSLTRTHVTHAQCTCAVRLWKLLKCVLSWLTTLLDSWENKIFLFYVSNVVSHNCSFHPVGF